MSKITSVVLIVSLVANAIRQAINSGANKREVEHWNDVRRRLEQDASKYSRGLMTLNELESKYMSELSRIPGLQNEARAAFRSMTRSEARDRQKEKYVSTKARQRYLTNAQSEIAREREEKQNRLLTIEERKNETQRIQAEATR